MSAFATGWAGGEMMLSGMGTGFYRPVRERFVFLGKDQILQGELEKWTIFY
ncbi:hypothetical protein BSG1_04860 [Bacillus sp. SG-1]|nr:hypothetical protein BSG1_04860 [Bacillus sp. SG-1]